MNQEFGNATRQPLAPASHIGFSSLFRSTRHGAHAVRHAAEAWLADRLAPQEEADGDLVATASLLIAELVANAALHGKVPGRRARLVVTLGATELRVEVTDCRGDRQPVACGDADAESGRGLLLVEVLADGWGVRAHDPGGKTVWCVCRR